jgi:LemA protein
MHTANIFLAALLVTAMAVAVHLVMTFNNLVALRNGIAMNWANIDVLLKQRHDEIPNLVAVCRGYKAFEQETLLRVTAARTLVSAARATQDIGALGPAESGLRAGVSRIFALAEQFPDLKANQNFLQLQARITGLENAIADRRESYNESVNVNNVRIQQFPELIIARAFGFREARMLEFEAGDLAPVNVAPLLGQSAAA